MPPKIAWAHLARQLTRWQFGMIELPDEHAHSPRSAHERSSQRIHRIGWQELIKL